MFAFPLIVDVCLPFAQIDTLLIIPLYLKPRYWFMSIIFNGSLCRTGPSSLTSDDCRMRYEIPPGEMIELLRSCSAPVC